MKQVGFWRLQLEVLILSLLLSLLAYLLTWLSPLPLAEVVSLASLAPYLIAAWRLRPGTGSIFSRLMRIVAWGLICAVLGGIVAWGLVSLPIYRRPLFGAEPGQGGIPLIAVILISIAMTLPYLALGA
jgi:hypothetical protein